MSYCRMLDADIYLYQAERAITCCMCGITPLSLDVCRGNSFNKDLFPGIGALDLIGRKRRRPWKRLWLSELERPKTYLKLVRHDPLLRSRTAALAHVRLHRSLGDQVPAYVDEQLTGEIQMIGDIVAPFKLMKKRKGQKNRSSLETGNLWKSPSDAAHLPEPIDQHCKGSLPTIDGKILGSTTDNQQLVTGSCFR